MESPASSGIEGAVSWPGPLSKAGVRSRPVAGITLGLLTAMAVLLTAFAASRAGSPGYSSFRVAGWWLSSVALLVGTAVWVDARASSPNARSISLRWPPPAAAALWIGMMLVAALPRLVALDRFPTVLDADEAAFMVHALEFQQGEMPNPFSTGYFSSPLGYMVLQGLAADALGDSVWAYRIASAIIGTFGVLATWRLGVRLFGDLAGALAGLLLATMPLHLHFSRNVLNNVTDPTFLALALLFGLRALERCRTLEALLAGMSLGLAFYGYYGGRALWVVVLVSLVVVAIAQRTPMRSLLVSVSWILAGFVCVASPLLMAFWRNPSEFGGHLSQVSSISIERFREDFAGTGRLYLDNMADALIYPLWGDPSGFFRHGRPFIGWELAVLVLPGLGSILVNALRGKGLSRLAALVVPYVLLVAGIALAIPPASQRYMSITPLLAIVAGAGLATAARLAARVIPSRERLVRTGLALLIVMSIGVANLRWAASENRQLETYGDVRTMMMWDIGWRIREGDGSLSRMVLAGAPYVFAYGFPNLTVLAPDVLQEDVEGAFIDGMGGPPLRDDAVLVLVPERVGERCAVERAYPDAEVAEVHSRDGTLLYIALMSGSPDGFARNESPAETTFRSMTDSPCPLWGLRNSGRLAGVGLPCVSGSPRWAVESMLEGIMEPRTEGSILSGVS